MKKITKNDIIRNGAVVPQDGMLTFFVKVLPTGKAHVLITRGDSHVEFEASFNPLSPPGHPLRYDGLPRELRKDVRHSAKIAIRCALAN